MDRYYKKRFRTVSASSSDFIYYGNSDPVYHGSYLLVYSLERDLFCGW